MIAFDARIELNGDLADAVIDSTKIENRDYVEVWKEEKGIGIRFRSRDYGTFLHTFNDLLSAISMVLKLSDITKELYSDNTILIMDDPMNACISILKKAGCKDIVVEHCKAVTEVAEKIASRAVKKGYNIDLDLVTMGAMLHDIGRAKTNGVKHAVEGAEMIRELGLSEEIIKIIERHIGGGLTEGEVLSVGLPPKNYIPETIEEKIVCHADNLIAATERQSLDDELRALRKKGHLDAAERVKKLHEELSGMCGIDIDEL